MPSWASIASSKPATKPATGLEDGTEPPQVEEGGPNVTASKKEKVEVAEGTPEGASAPSAAAVVSEPPARNGAPSSAPSSKKPAQESSAPQAAPQGGESSPAKTPAEASPKAAAATSPASAPVVIAPSASKFRADAKEWSPNSDAKAHPPPLPPPTAYYNLGVALSNSGYKVKATQCFLQAKEREPVGSEYWAMEFLCVWKPLVFVAFRCSGHEGSSE